ncbi:MAG TPA: MerR family transcriptional regulator [Candidatus Dormibacteraeota bacterium]|nr:MerR family transcriptional regulator [Candidatus Dormibacteraeota bacterium]
MRQPQHYSIGEVAALLGVSPHAIRAWERRYGILSPERGVNRHRRYSAEDIEFLRDVKRTADINGTSLRLALEIVNGSVELAGGASPTPQPAVAETQDTQATTQSDVWRTLGDTVPFLIMLLDSEGVIVEANVAVARLLGVVRQRIAGRKFIGLVDPFDRMKASMLYRPRLRAVASWELNLTTPDGARLFSFSSWPVLVGDNTYLAVMGSEMFTHGGAGAPQAATSRGVGGGDFLYVLQGLFDRLPVGVAVATVGREPRIVYSNLSLSLQLGLSSPSLLGRRVSDVLGHELFKDVLRANTQGRTASRKLVMKHQARTVVIRPMFSANDAVTSCLIVVMTEAPVSDDEGAKASKGVPARVAGAAPAPGYRKRDR